MLLLQAKPYHAYVYRITWGTTESIIWPSLCFYPRKQEGQAGKTVLIYKVLQFLSFSSKNKAVTEKLINLRSSAERLETSKIVIPSSHTCLLNEHAQTRLFREKVSATQMSCEIYSSIQIDIWILPTFVWIPTKSGNSNQCYVKNKETKQNTCHLTKVEHRHTFRKSCKCLSTPILTSSRSFKKPLKTGTKSPAVSWSPRMTASSCIENASVRRTFHCKINGFYWCIIWRILFSCEGQYPSWTPSKLQCLQKHSTLSHVTIKDEIGNLKEKKRGGKGKRGQMMRFHFFHLNMKELGKWK